MQQLRRSKAGLVRTSIAEGPLRTGGMRLFIVDGKNVQGGLGLEAADYPQSVPESTRDEVVGEYAGVVVASGDYVQVERLAAIECRAVVDPARSATVAYDILDDPDRLVGVPVVREPVPVSVALELACIREGAVRVVHG